MSIEAITSTIVVTREGDDHTCVSCGRSSDRVRSCCDADDAARLCDGCYMKPDSPHTTHDRRRTK